MDFQNFDFLFLNFGFKLFFEGIEDFRDLGDLDFGLEMGLEFSLGGGFLLDSFFVGFVDLLRNCFVKRL